MTPDQKAAAVAQCSANILAVLRFHKLPAVTILTAMTDRITASASSDFSRALEIAGFAPWNFVKNHGTTARRGWREDCAFCSLQVVQHSTGVWELDIDARNPSYGAALVVGHFWEVLRNKFGKRKTDPFAIARGLKKRGVLA